MNIIGTALKKNFPVAPEQQSLGNADNENTTTTHKCFHINTFIVLQDGPLPLSLYLEFFSVS